MTFLVAGDLFGGAGALWVSLLIALIGQGSLLMAVAWLLHQLLKTERPDHRSRLWTTLFLILMFVPLVTFTFFQTYPIVDRALFGFLPNPVVTVVQDRMATDNESIAEAASGSALVASEPAVQDEVVIDLNPSRSGPAEFHNWSFLVFIWLAGVAFLAGRAILRTGVGLLVARENIKPASVLMQETARGVATQLQLSRSFTVVTSNVANVPFLSGFFGVRLVLPHVMNSWPADGLRLIFLHELAHLKRRDTFRIVLGELVCALYWFNPLVWRSAAAARLDLELACDDVVCRHGVRKTDYARLLLQFAAGTAPAARHHEAPGFARSLGLEVRLHHVLAGPRRDGRWTRVRRCLSAVPIALALVGTVALTGAVMVEQSPYQPTPETVFQVAAAVVENDVPPTEIIPQSIHDLAENGDLAQISFLLQDDPMQLDLADAKGMTPLAVAAWHGHLELVADLLARGAQPDHKNNNGLTPLFCAVDRGRAALARTMIESGAEVMTYGYNGRGLIHMAARAGDSWVLSQAIARGADVSATDRSGVTPLDLAIWGRHDGVIEILERLNAQRSNRPNPNVISWNSVINNEPACLFEYPPTHGR